jgi:hypothetical protein
MEENPQIGLQPDGAKEGLIKLEDLIEESFARDWLVLEHSLENHGQLYAATSR